MSIPSFFVLQSVYNNKYMQFTRPEENPGLHEFLQFNGDELISPYTKFEAEISTKYGGLYHLKSCYNNKYLVKQSAETPWIVVSGKEIEEDQSKLTCTLFKSIQEDGHFKLLHVQSQTHLSLDTSEGGYKNCLCIGKSEDKFKLIDWGALVILPRYVAFKGDLNSYLSIQKMLTLNTMWFIGIKNDGSDPSLAYEVSYTGDGAIRIRSLSCNRYWKCRPGSSPTEEIISADSDDPTDGDPNTVFWPARVDGMVNTITIRKKADQLYCMRQRGKGFMLSVLASNGKESEANFRFEECIKSRVIQDVKYHIMDVRFSSQKPVRGDILHVRNEDDKNDDAVSFAYKLTKKRSSSWRYTTSIKAGVNVTTAVEIPIVVVKEGLQFSVEYTHTKESTDMEEFSEEVTITDTVKIPAGYEVTIVGIVKQASASIPFSYRQIDTLYDDTQISTDMHDGVYYVENGYEFEITKSKPHKIVVEKADT